MIYLDTHFLKLNILDRKSTEFRDTKPCVKEDIDPIVVSAEMLVLFDKLQKIPLLFPVDGFSRH